MQKLRSLFAVHSVILIMLSAVAVAQNSKEPKDIKESRTIDDYYVDFPTPDLAAFALLGAETGQISRPGNLKELSASFSSFVDRENKLTPNVAVGWSPFRLAETIEKYQANPFRNSLLAIATGKESKGTTVGLAWRWLILDRSDPIKDVGLAAAIDSYFEEKYGGLAHDLQEANETPKPLFKILRVGTPDDQLLALETLRVKFWDVESPPDPLTTEAQISRFESGINGLKDSLLKASLLARLHESPLQDSLRAYSRLYIQRAQRFHGKYGTKGVGESEEIAILKRKFEKEKWNSFVVHLDVGTLWYADSSLVKRLRTSKWGFLAGTAFGVSSVDQEVIQFQYRNAWNQAESERWKYTVGGRILVGGSHARTSAEALFSRAKLAGQEAQEETVRFTIGGEVKITEGVWLEVAIGSVRTGGQQSSLISGLDFKYAFHKEQRFSKLLD